VGEEGPRIRRVEDLARRIRQRFSVAGPGGRRRRRWGGFELQLHLVGLTERFDREGCVPGRIKGRIGWRRQGEQGRFRIEGSSRVKPRRVVGQRADPRLDRAWRRRRLRVAPSAADWISLADAAEILAASNVQFRPSTIGAWARAGKLQSIKLGGRRFVRRGEVRALVTPTRRVRVEDVQPRLFEELGD
jgi:hypothetical protein